jgi:hypothetical protein
LTRTTHSGAACISAGGSILVDRSIRRAAVAVVRWRRSTARQCDRGNRCNKPKCFVHDITSLTHVRLIVARALRAHVVRAASKARHAALSA